MKAVKSFPRYLIDKGLIFQINKEVLHKFGLALVVDIDPNNKKQLAITALLETEDPEGFLYETDAYNVGQQNYERFLKKEGQEKLDARKEKYGFLVQESDDV